MALSTALIGLVLPFTASALAQAPESHAVLLVRKANKHPQQSVNYWTPQRMRQAQVLPPLRLRGSQASTATASGAAISSAQGRAALIPAVGPHQRFQPGDFGSASNQASASVQGIDTGDPTVFPNNVNGTVFGMSAGVPFSCSGSIVTAPNASTVLTAGHCIYDTIFSTKVVFVPGYRDGGAPYGIWPAADVVTSRGWISDSNQGFTVSAFDFGVLHLLPQHKQFLGDKLGALGIAFNQDPQQTYTEYGYPTEPAPYDGSKLYATTSPLTGLDDLVAPASLQIASDFGPGASGGPFVVQPDSTIESVATYIYYDDPNHIYGAYFGNIIESLYCGLGGLSVDGTTLYKNQGTAFIKVGVPCDGSLTVSGHKIQARSRNLSAFGGEIWIPVLPRPTAAQHLSRVHRINVTASLYFKPKLGQATREYTTVQLVERR